MMTQIARQMMAQVPEREADRRCWTRRCWRGLRKILRRLGRLDLRTGLRQGREHLATESDSPFLSGHIDFDRSS